MIIRAIRRGNYLHMDNSGLEDAKLSFKAKGVLAYLLSKPDGWHIQIKDLANHSTDGTHSIYSAMRNLRKLGYLEIRKIRDPGTGKLAGQELAIYELPRLRFSESRSFRASDSHALSNKERLVRKKFADRQGGGGSIMDPTVLNGHHPITQFSPAVTLFAKFSKQKGYHIVKKNLRSGQIIYARGANASGWSRQTLVNWEGCYQALVDRIPAGRIEKTVRWYITHVGDDEWLTSCHTFPAFCDRFDGIEKAMIRKKQGREYRDGRESETPQVQLLVTRRKLDGTVEHYDSLSDHED